MRVSFINEMNQKKSRDYQTLEAPILRPTTSLMEGLSILF